MNKEQFAELLNGRQYREEMTKTDKQTASANGLLVCYGWSDDLFEVDGIVNDEFGNWEGGVFYIVKKTDGSIDVIDSDSYEEINTDYASIPAVKITTEWCPKDLSCSWRISTDIPHATFDIFEGEDLYCRGIVIDKKDIEDYLTQNK